MKKVVNNATNTNIIIPTSGRIKKKESYIEENCVAGIVRGCYGYAINIFF